MKTPRNWRKAQTIWNFIDWLKRTKDIKDYFYIDDALWDVYYQEYLDTLEITFETDEL